MDWRETHATKCNPGSGAIHWAMKTVIWIYTQLLHHWTEVQCLGIKGRSLITFLLVDSAEEQRHLCGRGNTGPWTRLSGSP